MSDTVASPVGKKTPAICWSRIDEWTDCVGRGDLAPIAKVFMEAGSDRPEAHWNPTPDTLPKPLAFLVGFWRELARGTPPHLRHIDALRLKPALGHIMLLDPVDDGRDFRVRLYGTTIARISRLDMTGRLLSEHPASPYTTEYAIAASRAALRRGDPLFTSRKPVAAEYTSRWVRLALAFADDSGAAMRLLVGTVALDRQGRMLAK